MGAPLYPWVADTADAWFSSCLTSRAADWVTRRDDVEAGHMPCMELRLACLMEMLQVPVRSSRADAAGLIRGDTASGDDFLRPLAEGLCEEARSASGRHRAGCLGKAPPDAQGARLQGGLERGAHAPLVGFRAGAQ
ncbi:unnamed protein product [Prorocentrum cordatum]|uniref:Uncharacterized protein n=1 Tax=Prorocentrum cordatum TaxID=2364126 RepID=A0ABN9QLC1_9DINO|nr:unnamed protein product [Polarella glacialis]